MFKVNNKDIRKTPGIFVVNFEHNFLHCSSVSIDNFEQANAGWDVCIFRIEIIVKPIHCAISSSSFANVRFERKIEFLNDVKYRWGPRLEVL